MRTLTSKASDPLANITNFNEFIDADEPVILYFWAHWCGPCKVVQPVIAKLHNELTGISFGSVDVDKEPQLAQQYDVTAIPAVLVLQDGKVLRRAFGARTEVQLRALISPGS